MRSADPFPRERRVGDDHALDARRHHRLGDRRQRVVVEVGRDLDEDGHATGRRAPRRPLRAASTSAAFSWRSRRPGRVGRGDVDRQIVGEAGEARHPVDIVGDAVGGVAVGAEIDADDAAAAAAPARRRATASWPSLLKPRRLMIARCSAAGRGAARIAGLRPRRHGADLDEAEAEREQRVGHLAVLVEAGGEPDRIGEIEAEKLPPEPRIAPAARGWKPARSAPMRQPMRLLRVEAEEERLEQLVAAAHGARSGRRCRPSGESGIGLTQSTRREVERTVKMREERSAARRLVAERRPEPAGVDGNENKVGDAGEMPRGGLRSPAPRSRNG